MTPAQRGSGLGQELLRTLAAICVERGYHRLEWWVLDWNAPSIGFYESIGAVAQDEWTRFRLDGPRWRRTPGTATTDRPVCHRGGMFRLLGLLGGLSLVTDVGTGAPLEESLKRCVVAARLARAVGCPPAQTSELLYTSLLQHLGCTAYAHEGADVWGDDLAVVRLAFLTNFSDRKDVWRTWVPGLADATGTSRARVVATALTAGRKGEVAGPAATCEVARDASRWLGLPESVQADLFHGLTMWNGTGHPAVAGDDIPLATRLMHVAATAALFTLHAGEAEAVAQVRRRSGTYLDPDSPGLRRPGRRLVGDLAEWTAREALAGNRTRCSWSTRTASRRWRGPSGAWPTSRARGSRGTPRPWPSSRPRAVAGLGLDDQVRTVRVAGHLHDVGRVGVSSRIWDKAGPLSTTERDQARLHPYYSERILARTPALADVAKLAGQHHERCDGSGYHRGLAAAQLTLPSRVLAAADEYRTSSRSAPTARRCRPTAAAGRLRSSVRSGRLDPDAVRRSSRPPATGPGVRRTRPADLTDRQVEVLRMVAAGLSNQQIARRLVISRRTAEHHVQDIYVKIGASSRAGAACSRCSTDCWTNLGRSTHVRRAGAPQHGHMTTTTGSTALTADPGPTGCSPPPSSGCPWATWRTSRAAGVAIYALPPYVVGPVGSDTAGAGLAFGAFAVTALLLRPFAGRLSDRVGRRPLLVGGALLAAAMMLLTGLGRHPAAGRRAQAGGRCRRGRLLRGVLRRTGRPGAPGPHGRGAQLQLARPVPRPDARPAPGRAPRARVRLHHRVAGGGGAPPPRRGPRPQRRGDPACPVAGGRGARPRSSTGGRSRPPWASSRPSSPWVASSPSPRCTRSRWGSRPPASPSRCTAWSWSCAASPSRRSRTGCRHCRLGAAALLAIAAGMALAAGWASPAGFLLGAALMGLGVSFSTPAFFSGDLRHRQPFGARSRLGHGQRLYRPRASAEGLSRSGSLRRATASLGASGSRRASRSPGASGRSALSHRTAVH